MFAWLATTDALGFPCVCPVCSLLFMALCTGHQVFQTTSCIQDMLHFVKLLAHVLFVHMNLNLQHVTELPPPPLGTPRFHIADRLPRLSQRVPHPHCCRSPPCMCIQECYKEQSFTPCIHVSSAPSEGAS